MKLQSTAFIAGEVERLDNNTKNGARGERPFYRDEDGDEVVYRETYEALLALAVELAERVKDGRLREGRKAA